MKQNPNTKLTTTRPSVRVAGNQARRSPVSRPSGVSGRAILCLSLLSPEIAPDGSEDRRDAGAVEHATSRAEVDGDASDDCEGDQDMLVVARTTTPSGSPDR